MAKPQKPKPPEHLSGNARTWWAAMIEEFDFADDPAGLAMLTSAAVQLQRLNAYGEAIRRKGVIITDRFGMPKENPACVGERAAGNLFRLLCRELGIDPDNGEAPRAPRIAPGTRRA